MIWWYNLCIVEYRKVVGDSMGKYVTNLMINEFKLRELGMDFMGYSLQEHNNTYTFHHLIVPRRNCASQGLGDGYYRWNGAIIFRSPHDYLHTIERYDYDRFSALTSEMVDENIKGRIDPVNLENIDDILQGFEREYCGHRTKKGRPLIKEEYTRRLVLKKF